MAQTPLPIQYNSTENLISGANDGVTLHRDASPLVDSPPGKTIERGEPGIHQAGGQTYSPQPFDTFSTPGLTAFLNSYPYDATSSYELFEPAEEASSPTYTKHHHLSSPLDVGAFGYSDARDATLPTRVAAAATVYASQNEITPLFSPRDHQNPSFPPQGTSLFHLGGNTGPPPGSATSTTAYMGGAPGHHDDRNMGHHHHFSPPFRPVADPGYGSSVMSDNPVPYSTPDPLIQGMQRMRLNSRSSISPHPESAGQQPFVFSPPTGYADPHYTSPGIIEVNRQDHQSSVPASTYGGNNYPTQYHYLLENGMRSWGGQMSTQTHGEVVSGPSYRATLPPYPNTGYQSDGVTLPHYDSSRMMMFDQMPDPRLGLHGHVSPYALYGQAAPGEGNITAGSFAYSDDRYDYLLQQPATWDGRMLPPTTAITDRTQGTPSWLYHHRAPSSSTSTTYSSDAAVSAQPRNVRPVQHRNPRRRNTSFISPYRRLGAALQGTSFNSGDGHFVASPSALSDEDRTDCSPPATSPPKTELTAQNLLKRVLGPTPRLKNEALIKLILLTLRAPFYRMDEMEPTGDSEDGMALLTQIQSIPGYPSGAFDASSDSIFTVFVSHSKFRCLICGSSKQAMVRAIGCVRSHLNHRPFPCLGENGCKSCPKGYIIKRFFTASLLHDHCSKQERAIECTYCGKTFTSNIKRHWDSKHNEIPFPYDDYPNYVPEESHIYLQEQWTFEMTQWQAVNTHPPLGDDR